MKSFKQLLESKQIGILYHFTTLENAWVIIGSKTIKRNQNAGDFSFGGGAFSITHDREGISFTRNHDLRITPNVGGNNQSWGSVRLVLDGNKLSNKYKIEPFLDTSHSISRKDNQAEEIIRKDEVDISNVLIRVDINVGKELSDRLNDYTDIDEEGYVIYGTASDEDVKYERQYIADFIKYCRKHNIKIKLLKHFKQQR